MFTKSLRNASVSLLLLGALACGDEGGPGDNDLLGTWNLTAATVTSVADPQTEDDLVASGLGMTLVFTATEVTVTITITGFPPQTFTSPYSSSGTGLTLDLDDDGVDDQGTFNVSGNTLTISSTDTYDFGNGDEAAVFEFVFAKQ